VETDVFVACGRISGDFFLGVLDASGVGGCVEKNFWIYPAAAFVGCTALEEK